jgi:phosphatidylserine/phosphatidylglycerophosphate/cardiolipin synthase-like enzyme
MNDRSTKLKRMADSERKSRTDLIKSILSGTKQMVSLGTFLFGHPDLIGWVPKDRRIYLAIGEADIEFTKADAIADPGKYAWKRSDLATNAAHLCLLRAVPGHHLKYVLVDPYDENSRGLLLTSNLTPSGVDVESPADSKVSSHELAIELTSVETADLASLAKYSLFGTRGVREFKQGGLQPVSPIAIEPPAPASLLMNGFKQSSLTDAVLACVSGAKSSVHICTYTFDADSALFPVIRRLVSTGVEVRIMLNNSLANKRICEALGQNGVKVAMVDRMHAKAILVDGSSGVVCTANFCRSGLADGINIGVRLSPELPERLELVRRFFTERA